jgi:hypothetical protein
VQKQHRSQGIDRQLLLRVLRESDGINTMTAINPINRSSMAAHRRAVLADPSQERPIGRCVALRCFRVSAAWCSNDLTIDRHFTFGSHSDPISIQVRST